MFHEHPLKIIADVMTITKLIKSKLPDTYSFEWYVTERSTVMEVQPEWMEENKSPTQAQLEVRDKYVEQQRQLMDFVIAEVGQELASA